MRRNMPNVYKILQYPARPLLRQTKSFSKFSKAGHLEDYLHEATLRNKGLAVAANQLGLDISAFFMRVNESNTFMINPRIVDTSIDTVLMDEGCLSINGVLWHIRRPKEVFVEWHDAKGNLQEREFSGLEARVIMHELDHLNGHIIPDYLDDELFDLFIEACASNLKKPNTYVDVSEEIVIHY